MRESRKNLWNELCFFLAFLVLGLSEVNAGSFDIKPGFRTFKLGSNELTTYLLYKKEGGLHMSEGFCALTGLHTTSAHESDPHQHHRGGHVRPVSYAVTLNSDGNWVVKYAGGRPSDSIMVGCFKLNSK